MKGQSTLSVTDNRTGRTYQVPIKDEAIPAMALRDIKVDDGDFGLLSYDPAFMNTASRCSAITFIDGEQGILRYRGYLIQELAERVSLRGGLAAGLRRPAGHGSWPTGPTRSTTTPSSRRTSRSSSTASTTTPTMGILVGTVGALSTFYPDAKRIGDPEVRRQIVRLIAKIPPWPPTPTALPGPPLSLSRQRAVVRGNFAPSR